MADIILKDGTGTPQTFEDVASITVPKSGGGTAKFSAVSGNIHITQNGAGIDVSSYETASVSVSAGGGSNIDFGVNIGDTLDTIYFNTKHDTSALDTALANAPYPNTSELAGITMLWNNALVCTLGTSSLYVHIGDLSSMQPGTYIIYVMQSETPTVLYSTKALDASAVIPGMVLTPGWQVSKFTMGVTVTVSAILDDLLAIKDNYFARTPQAYGEWELPQLHAPTISIAEDTLTITNPDTNGDFVTAFCGYANGVSVGAIPVSSNPLDLTSLGFPAGDYTLTATCKGTNFAESEQSNSLAYTNIFYNVSSVLVGCSSSNSAATVRKGEPYTATISALAGYKLLGATVTVTMGGEDITATAYTYSNKQGLISIASVSGEIAISVTAVVDAVTFISRSLPADITIYSGLQPNLLCFNDELWITAMKSNYYDGFCKSTDGGKTWAFMQSSYLTKLSRRKDMEPIITNGSSLVGYNLTDSTSDSAYYSMDGNTFTKKSAPNMRFWWASGDLYFYAPNSDGVYVTSDITADGVKTGLGISNPTAKFDIIKYVNGTHFYMKDRFSFVTTAKTTVYYSSAAFDTNKSASWNVAKIIPAGYSYGDVADLTYADNAYYAVTDTGKIIKVTNFAIGGTKIADLDSALTWSKIEYNGENFVAIPATGKKYAVSSDGVSWTYGELDYDEALNDMKVVNGKFVLLGATKIYTSE